jgi:hypothetical protein
MVGALLNNAYRDLSMILSKIKLQVSKDDHAENKPSCLMNLAYPRLILIPIGVQ